MITKKIYVENLKTMLDKWNSYLDKLENKAKDLTGTTKLSFDEKLADIRTKRDTVEEKLGKIKDAADSVWASLRREAKEARGNLVDAFSKAHVQISAILEPKHE